MRRTKNGKYVWDNQRGRLYPVPMGAEGTDDPPGDPKGGGGGDPKGGTNDDPKGGGGGGSGEDEPVQLTQTQLNSMMAREKNQGRQAAQQEVADQLGVPLEEAKAILTAAREREDAEKSEAQRARDAADREKQEAETEKAAAARERYEARVERALLRAGIDGDDETKLSRISRMITAEVGASQEDITADVEQIKTDFPELFGAGEGGGGQKPPPSSDPRGKPPERRGSEDAMARGAARAKDFSKSKTVQFDPAKAGSGL